MGNVRPNTSPRTAQRRLFLVLVSLLALCIPLLLTYDSQVVSTVNEAAGQYPGAIKSIATDGGNTTVRIIAIAVTLVSIGWAIWQSKRESGAGRP